MTNEKKPSDNMTKAELLEYIKAQQAEMDALAKKDEDIPEAKDDSSEDVKKWLNERVPFYAFKDNDKYKDDIVVGCNGKNFIIQRGKQVMIPRYVKIALDNSTAQNTYAANVTQGFQAQFESRSRELGL